MSRSFELPDVDWVTVGTVGDPGSRTFYLQARQEDQLVTLKVEKQQVAAITQFLGEILSDLPAPEGMPANEDLDLVEPVLAEWVVGGLQLGYDSSADRIVVMAEEVGAGEDAEAETGLGALDTEEAEAVAALDAELPGGAAGAGDAAVGRLSLTRSQAAGLVKRGLELMTAGRPVCALCGHPIDPDGHACPRSNGHSAPPP